MAKDPAFLFYSGDFLVGTALMTDQETGQYIKLLCFMHQSGHIAKEDMINICPNVSPRVVAKFKIDSEGRYYNERLDKEVDKRKKYSESRRINRMKKDMNNISKTHDESYVVAVSTHMENENENRNENRIKERVQGEETDFTDFESWTADIVSGNDWKFHDKLRNMAINVNGKLNDFATSHLALLAKYPKMKPPDQNRFRISLIGHIQEKLKQESHASHTGKTRTTSAIIESGKDYSAKL